MTDSEVTPRRLRFVTAAALFDGHDASINIVRRLLQQAGAEVIHLGHNRAALDVAEAAVEEDADAIAVSSYQGGHIEFFGYLLDLLRERGAHHIRVFGGGGGVIVPAEARALEAKGITRIYSPDDGRALGLEGMIADMLARCSGPPEAPAPVWPPTADARGRLNLARWITRAGEASADDPASRALLDRIEAAARARPAPVIGITGTGGAGKSTLTDELLRRFLFAGDAPPVAILAVDPTKRKTGGALLGDRIRMNAAVDPRVCMRSLATRGSTNELSASVRAAVRVLRAAGFPLILLETAGIGQGASAVTEESDLSVYVMTPDFGAASQLEKIDMLDFADIVVVNKSERQGGPDALRDVRRQVRRSRGIDASTGDDRLPVFGTVASRFNDAGVNAVFEEIRRRLPAAGNRSGADVLPATAESRGILPPRRSGCLGEIADAVEAYRQRAAAEIDLARRIEALETAAAEVGDGARVAIEARLGALRGLQDSAAARCLAEYPALRRKYAEDALVTRVRDRDVSTALSTTSLAGLRIPRVALPRSESAAEILRYLLFENVPGSFPFTAGVFPLRRHDEEPRRQFAGEGTPERTNRRFHFLSREDRAKRLSTAFDSVTLYGQDPDPRPDIWGKVGESGVSVCTIDDMRKLYAGFDLCDPNTSVSMTINGPAPILLAMFLGVAVDQAVEAHTARTGIAPGPDERERIASRVLETVRGTVQADILKEDQAQNTCIFSTEFALRMMGDMQAYFVEKGVRNYYSVSISGYHIAEAGANPVTQLAFTLANGFTYVEYYRARGMSVDDFAPNLSFFFSNGLDPEYSVLGRVARRIWAIAMRDVYGANERSQKLKYHIQTSGRSLHAREVQFNDIRTTLQALLAVYDNCNSLHTNAYDEAITTPTEESVRRAMAIQMIIGREFGPAKNENGLQGAYIVDELTDLVEEAVLAEFRRLSERGGVLGAMETQYQRSRIQEESLLYEKLKHSGELPIVGVNTFLGPHAGATVDPAAVALTRATPEEKEHQIRELRRFQERHAAEAPEALDRLRRTALEGGNIFAELLSTVRVASLGQITRALYEVGGEYRRNM